MESGIRSSFVSHRLRHSRRSSAILLRCWAGARKTVAGDRVAWRASTSHAIGLLILPFTSAGWCGTSPRRCGRSAGRDSPLGDPRVLRACSGAADAAFRRRWAEPSLELTRPLWFYLDPRLPSCFCGGCAGGAMDRNGLQGVSLTVSSFDGRKSH